VGALRPGRDEVILKILLVEDDSTSASFVAQGLREENYLVDWVNTGPLADQAVSDQDYDAILLDVMIPGVDGFDLCRQWRSNGLSVPILFITARDGLSDRVHGLDLGADDYLVKPFAFEELLARLRARLRRIEAPPTEDLAVGSIRIQPAAHRCFVDGAEIELTPREYLMIEILARNPDRVVSRTQLWEQAWETGSEPNSNVVDVYVGYLRSKLGSARSQLQTVRGSGYRLCPLD
jgi:two-component system, OmpR family, response regulator